MTNSSATLFKIVTDSSGNGLINFVGGTTLTLGVTSSLSSSTPGILSLPTLTTTGTPTWTPTTGEYPVEWNKVDGVLWIWNGTAWQGVTTSSSGAGYITGNGVANRFALWDGTSDLTYLDAFAYNGSGFTFTFLTNSSGIGNCCTITDGAGNYIELGNGAACLHMTSGVYIVDIARSGSYGLQVQDGTRTVTLCDAAGPAAGSFGGVGGSVSLGGPTYAVDASGDISLSGSLWVGGQQGKTHTIPLRALNDVTGGPAASR